MEKERSSKVIAIVALLVGVVGLSLGFAAFSNSLNISSSAKVEPTGETFNVDFSSSSSETLTEAVRPTVNPSSLTATEATLDNTGNPTISGLGATFTEPGQSVTYTFYARNTGEYKAYLNSITFKNAQGGSNSRVCTAGSGATGSLVSAACEGINISVKVGSEAATKSSIADITNHVLATNASEEIKVTISYEAGSERADGDFSVAFGDVELVYASAD